MIQADLNTIKSWNRVNIKDLVNLLKSQGFHFVKHFSTSDYRIFVSSDSKYLLVFEKNQGKLYSTKDRSKVLHSFSVISDDTDNYV